MIEYGLRQVALVHALTLTNTHGGNVDSIIDTAKRLENYLLHGQRYKKASRDPSSMSMDEYRAWRNTMSGGQSAAADYSTPQI